MDGVAKLISTIFNVADEIHAPICIKTFSCENEMDVEFSYGRAFLTTSFEEINYSSIIKEVLIRSREHEGSVLFLRSYEKGNDGWKKIYAIQFHTWWDGEPYPFTALGDDWNEVCENFLACLPSPAPVKPFSHIREDGVCVCGMDVQKFSMTSEVYDNCIRYLEQQMQSQ